MRHGPHQPINLHNQALQPAPVPFDQGLEDSRAGRQCVDGAARLSDRNVVTFPGVGREGGEALDGFDVRGVVVAHDGAMAGEEAEGVFAASVDFCWFLLLGIGGGYLRKVGGVLVDVRGQEVLHGFRVEHDEVWVEFGSWMDAEGAGSDGFGDMEVEDLDAGDLGLFLFDPRFWGFWRRV